MFTPDAFELARWQLAIDHQNTTRWARLYETKLRKITASPLAYLRGSAALFYRLLSEYSELRDGPAGEGWITGDAHLENFGVYRSDAAKSADTGEADVAFDVNDFDEAVVAPLRFDVLRLTTSLLLGARALVEGKEAIALASGLVGTYVDVALGGAPVGPEPRPVKAMVENARRRSHRDLLEKRTTLVGGQRRFLLDGEHYQSLAEPLRAPAMAAFRSYVAHLPDAAHRNERCDVLDLAFRIAGTGSLGALRVAVLTRGKSDGDAGWLFDMKEQGKPAASVVVDAESGAERVLAAIRASTATPPRMLGTTSLGETSLLVRRLTPQEDKLEFSKVDPKDLAPTARHLGALLGRCHRRGMTTAPATPWSPAEQEALVDRAIALAGVHEATYLAMCRTA